MAVKAPGYGRKGVKGDTPALSIGTVTTLPPGSAATASITPAGALSLSIPQGGQGTPGLNATATPLSSATPKALGTAAPGSATDASRSDHVHPLPGGRLEFIGNVTVQQTLLVGLSAGNRRATLPLAGVAPTDRLVFAAISPCAAGCEALNIYPGTNQTIVAYSTPALLVGAVIEIPVAIYRVIS